jgi:membrane-bound lytic murein transglycosylase MltF
MKIMTHTINLGRRMPSSGRMFLSIFVIGLITSLTFPAVVKKILISNLDPLNNLIHTPYGPPLKYLPLTDSSYDFKSVKNSFGKVNLKRVGEIRKHNLEDLILSSLDLELRKRLRPHLTDTLEISQKYELDPYWVLAIMWTESHYVHSVKSHKNAHGLMQVLPSTAKTLVQDDHLLIEPTKNIEVGALYLKKLLGIYRNNYQVATVAYNQGPGNIKKKGKKLFINNQYLIKVKNAYKVLTVNTNDYFKKVDPPFHKTFLARNQWVKKYFQQIFSLLPKEKNQKLVYAPPKKIKKREKFYL